MAVLCSCKNSKMDSFVEDDTKASNQLLDKVLDYYPHQSDSLKREAAKFLCKNIYLHYEITSSNKATYNSLFSELDTASRIKTSRLSKLQRDSICDFIVSNFPPISQTYKLPDIKVVTPEFICSNTDLAIKAWKQSAWHASINFSDFCEYILPYHVNHEQVQQCRLNFHLLYSPIANAKDKLSDAFAAVNTKLGQYIEIDMGFSKYYPFPIGINELIKGKVGVCSDACCFKLSVLRAVGIPVALDYLPHWGNIAYGHSMIRLIDKSVSMNLMTNQNTPVSTKDIIDVSSSTDPKEKPLESEDIPQGVSIQYIRTVPKVYRTTWSAQPEMLKIIAKCKTEEMATGLPLPNMLDVTNQYVTCADISIGVDTKKYENKIAYLCVFDRQGWTPVAFAPIDNVGKAKFEKIGKGIVYLPVIYRNNQPYPIGLAFYCNSLGEIKQIRPQPRNLQQVKLSRKYPVFANIAYYARRMKGAVIEGANNPDFNNATKLYTVTKPIFSIDTIHLNAKQKFRYIRYAAPENSWCNIAELAFYSILNGRMEKLKGSPLGTESFTGFGLDKAFDNNYSTYYTSTSSSGWIGLDLGTHKDIRTVVLCPRTDTNFIIQNLDYELCYWNNQWISLGRQTADKDYLVYNNIPSGALLWLKCLSAGKEERIFTYENKQQVWW